jgi:hypothetical protein
MEVTISALLYWSCNSLFVRIRHPFVSVFGPYTLLKISIPPHFEHWLKVLITHA